MTEADARHLLWRWPGDDGLEGWIAAQPWESTRAELAYWTAGSWSV